LKAFEEIENVKNSLKIGRPPSETNEEKALDILQSFVENLQTSVCSSRT